MAQNIPIFPPLFVINNNKIYKWSIEIKHKANNVYTIITTHGENDGKMIIHQKDIEEGKAKRTVLEQTIQEVKKKWSNKKEKELYHENIENIDNPLITNVRPMLASKFSFDSYTKKSRAYKIPFPAFIQPKLDGIRCIAYIKDGDVILESRKGIAFQNFKLLKEQLKKLFEKIPSKIYFDGELYTNELDFETISGLIRLHEKSCTEKDLSLINKMQYHIYDYIDINNLNLTYIERYTFLNKLIKVKSDLLYVPVETVQVNALDDIKTYHDKYVKDGYEGIMIRASDGIYEINKRSKYLQKYKEFLEEEFEIIGYDQGTGDTKGTIIWKCITKDGNVFSVTPNGTFESRKLLYKDGDKYIGKQLTVTFQEYTADGTPRFGIGKGIRDIY